MKGLLKEQKRLKDILEKKDLIIQRQGNIIERITADNMKQLDINQFNDDGSTDRFGVDRSCRKVPKIIIEDTSLPGSNLHLGNNTDKPICVNLKRQTVVFKRGSERPKFAPISTLLPKTSTSCSNLERSIEPKNLHLGHVSDNDSGRWSLERERNNSNHHHTIIRSNSYEKALGIYIKGNSTSRMASRTLFHI